MSDAGVLAGPDAVLDAGVRSVPGIEEGQLSAGGVGGERLVAVAVTDLEGVQNEPGWGCSRPTMTRIQGHVAVQRVRSSMPVTSTTSACSRRPPSALFAGVQAHFGMSLMASRTASVTG